MNNPRHNNPAVLEPVVKSVSVPLPVDKAFHLFTEGYARWWPLITHSVGLERALSCTLHPGTLHGRAHLRDPRRWRHL